MKAMKFHGIQVEIADDVPSGLDNQLIMAALQFHACEIWELAKEIEAKGFDPNNSEVSPAETYHAVFIKHEEEWTIRTDYKGNILQTIVSSSIQV